MTIPLLIFGLAIVLLVTGALGLRSDPKGLFRELAPGLLQSANVAFAIAAVMAIVKTFG